MQKLIRERDEIEQDRFDSLVENSIVLDFDKSMEADAFFKLASGNLAVRIGIGAQELSNTMSTRERQSSTVLSPTLAIPHIVIEGEKTFDILLARCRKGIYFSEEYPNVHTVFVLVGTKDERNFHLRVLSAIAQIVQDPGFDKKWITARSEQALRDIILLGKRRRDSTFGFLTSD